jgi:TfoX/Sxy family transcriptional regulator of competence genes
MDIVTPYYRIDTTLVNERELEHRLEQARIVAERRETARARSLSTGSLTTIPAAAH